MSIILFLSTLKCNKCYILTRKSRLKSSIGKNKKEFLCIKYTGFVKYNVIFM